MSKIFTFILLLCESVLFLTLLQDLILIFFSKLRKKFFLHETQSFRKYLFVIPAYKDDYEILIRNIKAILQLNYPKDNFKIILIADCIDETNLKLISQFVKTVKVNLQTHSKINSLKSVISEISSDIDFIVILDSDNIVHPEFLMEINKLTDHYEVIQGRRVPFNTNTKYELIDSLSDTVYEKIDHYYPSLFNLSSTISGSGFIISKKYFEKFIPKIDVVGGFDKVLQSLFTLENIKIGYTPTALVYDQKVKTSDAYVKQRRRWIYYYFYNAINYGLRILLKGIFRLNINQIYFGLKSLRPPFNLIGLILIASLLISIFLNPFSLIVSISLFLFFLIYIIILLLESNQFNWKVLSSLPFLMFNQIKAILNISEAKKDSLKTKHYSNTS